MRFAGHALAAQYRGAKVAGGDNGKHSTPRIIPMLLRKSSAEYCGDLLFLGAAAR